MKKLYFSLKKPFWLNLNCNFFAFSLIELIITLIILSLIVAAFIPLITKKMKANDITVGSFGNNGDGAIGIKRNITKEDCDKLNAVFVEASADVSKPLCVLKYNIGDMGNENWAGVQKCSAGSTCSITNGGKNETATVNNLQPTCWSGKTAETGKCDAKYGNYDGCTRTVCNWTGANQMCSNYSLKGVSGWRLPTYEELNSFANNDNTYSNPSLSSLGLMFCSNSTTTENAPKCIAYKDKCINSYSNYCSPDIVWSSLIIEKHKAKSGYLNDNWSYSDQYLVQAFSARCVLDSISDIVPTGEGTDVIDNKLDSQADCDKLGAGLLFIPKETTGTKNMCVMKYNIGDMGNENWAGVQRCSAGGSCTVANGKSDAVTKDNLQATCWQGKTAAAGCNADFGGYDGCTRTLCNWTGANKLCENYRLGTYGWRLPTKDELISFTNETYSSKTAFENDGKSLMFCDHVSNSISPICETHTKGCPGSYNGDCHPHYLWSSTSDTSSKAWIRDLNDDWKHVELNLGFEFSARCVLDEDAYRHANTNQIMPTETELSSSCKDANCALCSKDKCYACKKGYELNGNTCVNENHCTSMNGNYCTSCQKGYALLNGKCLECSPSNGFVKVGNLCVMQYNIGDGYYRETWRGVQKCIAGNPCTVTNAGSQSATKEILIAACWQGKTSGNGCNDNFGGYDGCTRTVCNWTGANQMCTNIGWRLPTLDELTTFTDDTYSSKTAFESKTGSLMFCDYSDSSTSPVCPYLENGCLGAYGGHCYPGHVLSSSFNAPSYSTVWNRTFIGSWVNNADYLGYGFSARCVYDL